MEERFIKFVLANPSNAYLAVLGVLLACGLGLPIPEDIILVTGGYMVYLAEGKGLANPSLSAMLTVGLIGVLSGDSILFFVGKRLGPRVTQVWPFRLMINTKRMNKVQGFFARYGARTAFIARFAAGLRAPTYLLAGTAGMRFRTFILADGIAAMLSVPAWILLAWHFGAEIDRVKSWMAKSKYAVGAVLMSIACYVLYRLFRGWAKRRREIDQPPE